MPSPLSPLSRVHRRAARANLERQVVTDWVTPRVMASRYAPLVVSLGAASAGQAGPLWTYSR